MTDNNERPSLETATREILNYVLDETSLGPRSKLINLLEQLEVAHHAHLGSIDTVQEGYLQILGLLHTLLSPVVKQNPSHELLAPYNQAFHLHRIDREAQDLQETLHQFDRAILHWASVMYDFPNHLKADLRPQSIPHGVKQQDIASVTAFAKELFHELSPKVHALIQRDDYRVLVPDNQVAVLSRTESSEKETSLAA